MKKIIGILLLGLILIVFASGQEEAMDLILVLDTSSSMSAFYWDIREYTANAFLKEFLRIGDTFHLISFAGSPRIEISRRVEGIGDVDTIIGRLFLMYPLEPDTNVQRAMAYTEAYIQTLPRYRSKKIVLLTDGDPNPLLLEGAISESVNRIQSMGHDFYLVTAPLSAVGPQSGRPPARSNTAPTAQAPAPTQQAAPTATAPLTQTQQTVPSVAVPSPQTQQAAPTAPASAPTQQAAPTAPAPVPTQQAAPTAPAPSPTQQATPSVTVPSVPSPQTQQPAPTVPAPSLQTQQAAPTAQAPSPTQQAAPTPPAPVPQTQQATPSVTVPSVPAPVPQTQQAAPTQGVPVPLTLPALIDQDTETPDLPALAPAPLEQPALIDRDAANPALEGESAEAPAPLEQPALESGNAEATTQLSEPVQSPTEAQDSERVPQREPQRIPPVAAPERSRNRAPSRLLFLLLLLLILALLFFLFFLIYRWLKNMNRSTHAMAYVAGRVVPPRPREEWEKDLELKVPTQEDVLGKFAATQRRGTRAALSGNLTNSKNSALLFDSPPMLSIHVEDQNVNIGKRNIHMLKQGYTYTVGGEKSDFLIFLVPLPGHIGEIHFDGSNCTFVPTKPEFFPDIGSQSVPNCIGKTIRIVSEKKYELTFRMEQYEDPLLSLNQLLNSIEVPKKRENAS